MVWRYGEFNAAANRIARALTARDLPAGSIIGICADSGPWYAMVHFAAAKAGLMLAHINPNYTSHELSWCAAHAGCALVFHDNPRRGVVAAVRGSLPLVKEWIALPSPDDRSGMPQVWRSWLGGHPDTEPDPATVSQHPDEPFQLLYTSGTTGFPKGALISHGSKLRLGAAHALNISLRPADRVLSALPLFHHFGQWLLLVAVPLVGAEVAALPRFDAAAYRQALAHDRITHLPAVPTMLSRLLASDSAAHPAADPAADPTEEFAAPELRQIVYGGAPAPAGLVPRLRRCFPGVNLFQGFGQTETGYCLGLTDAEHDNHADSLGRPDIRSEIRLLDEEGRDVSPGEVGEIVARTPYLMNGYHREPEATADYFRFGASWGRTGDLAWRDDAGYYHLAGRRQELIITGGVNVYPAEVERVLAEHPAVSEAAVFGVPHDDWGEAVTAAVILAKSALSAGQSTTDADGPNSAIEPELLAHCRRMLAPFKCPKRIVVMEEFPRTASGKVRKADLRNLVSGTN